MGLMERLRNAEQHGRTVARDALERAREMGEDAERRIRQRMRIYPRTSVAAAAGESPSEVSQSQPAGVDIPASEAEDVRQLEAERKAIVSVNGDDVESNRADSKAA